MNKPKVCVLFITYNHVSYAGQALESIVTQKTNFPFVVVVGDDCSKDGTREIVLQYASRYPDKIILSNPVTNVGAEKNFNQLVSRCLEVDADYISYLEGDEYWMDEYKLQKQFDILEKDPTAGLVYGKYKNLDINNEFLDLKIPAYKSGYIFEDILLSKYLPSIQSAFFRTSILKEIFAHKNYIGLDLYLIAELARNHKSIYMDEFLFVYRETKGSITKIRPDEVTQKFTQVFALYQAEFPRLAKRGFRNGLRKLLYHQVEDNPSLANLLRLLKSFEFSVLHQRQIIKWFYLRAKIILS